VSTKKIKTNLEFFVIAGENNLEHRIGTFSAAFSKVYSISHRLKSHLFISRREIEKNTIIIFRLNYILCTYIYVFNLFYRLYHFFIKE